MAATVTSAVSSAVEDATQRLGHELSSHLSRRRSTVFERRWWEERILNWAMTDESVKIQMFRFVDALPMLRTSESVTRHLHEYFEEVRAHLPWAARLGLDVTQPHSLLGRALAYNARTNAQRMAKRFIAGSSVDEVFEAVTKLRRQGMAFTLDLLGEATISEEGADQYQQAYLDLLTGLSSKVHEWPENPRLDRDSLGLIPRVNASLKLSALDSQFRPIDAKGTAERVKDRLRPLIRAARENDCQLHIDMEHYAFKDLTLKIVQEILMEPEFRDFQDIGLVIQAYLPDAERDLKQLLTWVKKRGTPIWIRLVKGAYRDSETVVAAARGWPVPVYAQKWQSDENYERQTRFLMEHSRWLRPALASHNLRSLAHGLAWAEHYGVAPGDFEVQMLYGMGTELAERFVERGHRVRVYTPFGELLPGMAYFVRRLLENTSNESFLRHSFVQDLPLEELLMKPSDVGLKTPAPVSIPMREFQNEPLTDFSRAEARDAFADALQTVKKHLGKDYPLVINGRRVETRARLTSCNPTRPTQAVGYASCATPDDAVEAISAARSAYREWSRVEPQFRSEYLELLADQMRKRRFELAAWEVYEVGKPWAEADADIAEAIDFCMYYAQEMRRLSAPQNIHIPGEENSRSYRPRGVCVVIAPWNFPLAILTGMTVAALVTGNTVVMKPAEQSPVIAAKLMEMLQDIGIPSGVVNYLPGVGEEIGPELVGSPDIDMVTFTGSRGVGLSIYEQAASTDTRQKSVKRVIAEMGGKNAIIVDDDADLDEAILGVTQSAFGYSGQKCSACSRVVVLESIHDEFVKRLVAATRALPIGPAEHPGTVIGPVVDQEARERIAGAISYGQESAHLEYAGEVPAALSTGFFVAPHIFTDVAPDSELAQTEVFGPVLAVLKARDFNHAIQIANQTDYALTAGVFSRSPAHLKQARLELEAGNVYLNRGITGALVDRQPFGGYRLSGIGNQAGGPEYLLQFLIPVTVTENTLRRGFAPTTPAAETPGE